MKQTLTRVLAALALFCGLSLPASAQPVSRTQGNITGSTCAPGGSTTSCIQLGLSGMGTAAVQITGTFSGTITFTGSTSGSAFNNVGCTSTAAGSSAANTTTSTGQFICPVAGLSVLRVAFTSYVSGSALVQIQATQGGGAAGGGGGGGGSVTQGTTPWIIAGQDTAGSPTPGTVVPIQGVASGTAVPISNGQLTSMDQTLGSTTDAVAGDANGSINAHVRYANRVWASVWDSGNNRLNVAVANGSTTDSEDGSVASGQSSVALTIPLNYQYNGSAWVRTQADPCSYLSKSYVPFSVASATTTELIAASASNKNYICSFNIVVAGANNVALVEDDTAACASPTAGMAGGTTAATGWNFAANGGLQAGNGQGTVFKTAAANRYTCIITSGSAQTSGVISYVQVP